MIGALILSLALQATDFGVRVPGSSPTAGQSTKRVTGSFTCPVSRVSDGDSFKCRQGPRVRLAAIDAPEMPGSCRPGRKCAPGDPHAAKAKLASLILGRAVECHASGKSYDRIAAWCSIAGQDLSCAMVSSGHAIKLRKFDTAGRLRLC